MKSWQELQALVYRIEEALGEDCEVRSPDYIRDRSTGKLREVDVSVRRKVGSQPILIIEECRDHRRKVGVGFVEQVVQKRDDLGADKAVIISRRGFTAGARDKAGHHNVALMTIGEALEQDWRTWMQCHSLQIGYLKYQLHRVLFDLDDAADVPTPLPAPPTGMDDSGIVDVSQTIFFKADGTELGSISSFVNSVVSQEKRVYSDVQPGESPKRKALHVSVPGPHLHLRCGDTLLPIKSVKMVGDFWIEVAHVPFNHLNYRQADGEVVAELAEAAFEAPHPDGGGSLKTRLYLVHDTEGTRALVETQTKRTDTRQASE